MQIKKKPNIKSHKQTVSVCITWLGRRKWNFLQKGPSTVPLSFHSVSWSLIMTYCFLFNLAGEEKISVWKPTSQSSRTATVLQPIYEPLRVEILSVHMKEMWAIRDLQFEKAMPAGLKPYSSMSFPQLELLLCVCKRLFVGVCVCVCVFTIYVVTP